MRGKQNSTFKHIFKVSLGFTTRVLILIVGGILTSNWIIGGEDLRAGFKLGNIEILESRFDYEWRQYFSNLNEIHYDKSTADEALAACGEHCRVLVNPLQIPQYPVEILNPAYSNTPVLHGIEGGEWSFFNADKFGFKANSSEAYDSSHAIIVGDSHAQGAYISEPNDFTTKVRRDTGKSILNLGVSGQSLIGSVANLLVFAPKDSSHLFFIVSEVNDFHASPTDSAILQLFENHSFQKLRRKFRRDIASKQSQFLQKYSFHSIPHEANGTFREITFVDYLLFENLRGLNTLVQAYNLDESKVRQKEIESRVNQAFVLIKDVAEFLRIKNVHLIYVPDYYRITTNFTGLFRTERSANIDSFRNAVFDESENFQFNIIDLLPLLLEKNNRRDCYPFRLNGHLNERCYYFIADHISDAINQK